MFKDILRLTKHSAVYGVGNILSRALGFLLLPLYTNFLVPEEYAKAILLFTYLAFLNVIFLYGMDTTFLRFYILKDENNKPEEIFSTAYISLIISTTVFCSIMYIFSGDFSRLVFHNNRFQYLIHLAVIIIFFDTLSVLPFLILRAEEKSKQFVVLKFFVISINLLLNIIFVAVMKMGVKGIFISNAISSFLSLIFVLNIIINKLRFRFSKKLLSLIHI